MTKTDSTGFPANGATADALLDCARKLSTVRLADLVAEDGRRDNFSANACGLSLDYSRQRIDDSAFAALLDFANDADLVGHRDRLFAGEHVNNTEDRPALHMALRSDPGDRFIADGEDMTSVVHAELERVAAVVDAIHSGKLTGASGARIRHVVNVGIGGSDLGVAASYRALRDFWMADIRCHFVSAIDGQALHDLMAVLDPAEVLFVVCSKSFSTQETMANAERARSWIIGAFGEEAVAQQFIGVSANQNAMGAFGIAADRQFTIWDWVGGRYSVWSAVGLTLALGVGMDRFREFLAGAREMDRHFRSAKLDRNLPVVAALLDVWGINYLGTESLVVLPYTERLTQLPAHLQQLMMESLGKRVSRDGDVLDYRTGTIVWGGPGSDAQHAFMQLLHQGAAVCSAEFLLPAGLPEGDEELNRMNQANAIAQADALMIGRTVEGEPWRDQAGGHPSTMIVMDALTPAHLGGLFAFYEHRVFCCAMLWNINPFDQWGVELGKELAAELGTTSNTDRLLTKMQKRTAR